MGGPEGERGSLLKVGWGVEERSVRRGVGRRDAHTHIHTLHTCTLTYICTHTHTHTTHMHTHIHMHTHTHTCKHILSWQKLQPQETTPTTLLGPALGATAVMDAFTNVILLDIAPVASPPSSPFLCGIHHQWLHIGMSSGKGSLPHLQRLD